MAKKTELAIKRDEETGLVVMDIPSELAGRGTEQLTSEDRSIAWLKLLQGGSPEIKSSRTRVEGASPGMFYNSATGDLFNDVEITICTTERQFTEWTPEDKGGGFVGKHDAASPIVREAIAYSKQEDIWPIRRPNGNELIDTRYLYVLAGEATEAAVFAISSKKLKTYKNLMARIHNFRVLNSAGERVQPPLCAIRILCSSFDDSAKGHDFSNLTLEPAVDNDLAKSLLPMDDPRVKIGLQVADDFDNSRLKVDYAGERDSSDNNEVIDVKVFE